MVTSGVLSLTRSGLRDWILQRVSAVILGIYCVFLLGYFVLHPALAYVDWVSLFYNPWMRIFNVLALLSLSAHAWVGIWTVLTDYVKPLFWRLLLQLLLILGIAVMLFVGIQIIWGIY
jgi:succinate dehydrogenase / fumarate reductase membrane anchor subunit